MRQVLVGMSPEQRAIADTLSTTDLGSICHVRFTPPGKWWQKLEHLRAYVELSSGYQYLGPSQSRT